MLSTTKTQAAVVSSLVDIRAIPLNELAGISAGIVDEPIMRILPAESPVAPVPVAAFQSAI